MAITVEEVSYVQCFWETKSYHIYSHNHYDYGSNSITRIYDNYYNLVAELQCVLPDETTEEDINLYLTFV